MGQILYFIKVAECGNITKAAEGLFLTQSTLSKKIASIEEQIGLQLFVREKNKRLHLTSAGQYLYEQWKMIPQQVDESIQVAHRFQTGYNKSVIIGAIDSFCSEIFVMPLVDSFCVKYPNVHLRIETGSVQQLRQRLIQGDVDIIFSIPCDFEERKNNNIEWRIFGEQPCYVCMLRSNPLAQNESLDVKDLKGSTFVCSSPQGLPGYVDKVRRICASNGFIPNIKKYVSTDTDLSLNIMGENEIFLCNHYYYDQNNSRLRYIPLRNTSSGFVIAWRRQVQEPSHMLFVRHCAEVFQSETVL